MKFLIVQKKTNKNSTIILHKNETIIFLANNSLNRNGIILNQNVPAPGPMTINWENTQVKKYILNISSFTWHCVLMICRSNNM